MDGLTWPKCDKCGQTVTRADGRLLLKEVDVTDYWDCWISKESMRVFGPKLAQSDLRSVDRMSMASFGPTMKPSRSIAGFPTAAALRREKPHSSEAHGVRCSTNALCQGKADEHVDLVAKRQ